ncbi:HCP-like protein [Westerdykella ornata]|uniref:HCP-like protein n=1 Tax=Westerdykella ornata TaxID=318751 RepID=A0A6A6JYM2_WESOR|nr:HCP-like protein [Westerdykella ornata]KAF2281305.1 HCP-like protein [Westerdykella ornata]
MAQASVAPSESLPPNPLHDTAPSTSPPQGYRSSRSSIESYTNSTSPVRRKPLPVPKDLRIPSFNIGEHEDTVEGARGSRQSGSTSDLNSADHSRSASKDTYGDFGNRDSGNSLAMTKDIPIHQLSISDAPCNARHSSAAQYEDTFSSDDDDEKRPHAASGTIYGSGKTRDGDAANNRYPAPNGIVYVNDERSGEEILADDRRNEVHNQNQYTYEAPNGIVYVNDARTSEQIFEAQTQSSDDVSYSSHPHSSAPYSADAYYLNDSTATPSSRPSYDMGQLRQKSASPGSSSNHSDPRLDFNFGLDVHPPRTSSARPSSAYALGSELHPGGRTHSPHLSAGGGPPSPNLSPANYGRNLGVARRSPETRPTSYVDLLNLPYNQQVAPTANVFGNAQLRGVVGQNASLLDTKKTLDMYRQNVKKTQDNVVQYEFAIYMVGLARELMAFQHPSDGPEPHAAPPAKSSGLDAAEILREARQILQKLADRSYPFAQYYLADGYASGLFNKDKPDYDRAFPLFVAASKHGHAESGYRAALCYEFGWGCRKDYAKAVQFYRAAASKNHPGAATRLGKACLTGDMGLQNRYKEGVKWLKRATEAADHQYNSAPYELGLLHETGFGDDIFKDEVYAAQLFTQAADLGHPYAALKLGEAYEHGLLRCPKDPAVSVHYYNCAAQAGVPEAMMNLCAWYIVGAEPVLEKDENEAYEWAKRAAEQGLPKAEYAVGYFTEMGIGCQRDPLEANVWYVRAADHGDERAKQRLAVISAAASGQQYKPGSSSPASKDKLKKGSKDENCVVM